MTIRVGLNRNEELLFTLLWNTFYGMTKTVSFIDSDHKIICRRSNRSVIRHESGLQRLLCLVRYLEESALFRMDGLEIDLIHVLKVLDSALVPYQVPKTRLSGRWELIPFRFDRI